MSTEEPENNVPPSEDEPTDASAQAGAGAEPADVGDASGTPAPADPQPPADAAAEGGASPTEDEAEEPVIADQPVPAEGAEEPAEEAQAGSDASAESPPAASEAETPGSPEEGDYEPTPRQKPEIPGADLEPVFIPQEQEQYLDAEARAAAEAEAEEAARARAAAEAEVSTPIADAAIDLAAGARYTATGKRKSAVARVVLRPGAGEYKINGKSLDAYFPRETLRRIIRLPLETVGYESRMDVVARMHGGGVSAQAGALRHGISRALIEADPNLRGELKRRGFLTRDPRVKERKKAGLKKARKRPQFSKR